MTKSDQDIAIRRWSIHEYDQREGTASVRNRIDLLPRKRSAPLISAQPIDHEDICKVARELTKEYSLTPEFSIVIARCAKEPMIHVMTIIGYERMMPKLPTNYKGCIIEQSKSDRPIMSPAYR